VGIHVEIVSLLQEVNLDTMGMTNMLVLRLPNDDQVKLPVSEEDTQRILNARVGAPPVQVEALPPPRSIPETAAPTAATSLQFTDKGAAEFGGDPLPEPTPTPEVASTPTAVASSPRRRLQVTKDAFGYPVVHGMEGSDPGEITERGTGASADEDGVASI
jgi:hypothetical protein